MTITPRTLTQASAAAAVAAGVTFIGVQIGHPHLDADTITTTEMAVRGSFKVLMAVLALVAITGLYLGHVRRNGVLGLVGYLIFAAGYLLITTTSLIAVSVLPTVVDADRDYVSSVLEASKGGTVDTDIGALEVIFQLQGLGYLAGGLIFGIAVSGPMSAALAVMPDAFYRILAFPNAIALIGLGYSLWTTTRTGPDTTGQTVVASRQAMTAGVD